MVKSAWPDWSIYVRDLCKCVYCGFDGTVLPAWRHLLVDHVVPRRSGGTDSPENKVVCCLSCNFTKGIYDPREHNVGLPREQLIENARRYIGERRVRADEEADFRLMLSELGVKSA